jgi:hypothetical protein
VSAANKAWRARHVAARQAEIAARRKAFAERVARFGLALPVGIEVPWFALSEQQPEPLPYPCRARFIDGAISDTVLIERAHPFDPPPNDARCGGEIAAIEPSPLALPPWVIGASLTTLEYRMGSFEPLEVSDSDRRGLIPAPSYFVDEGGLVGSRVIAANRPSVSDFRTGRIAYADTCAARIVRVWCA